jgi:hypothetical protein
MVWFVFGLAVGLLILGSGLLWLLAPHVLTKRMAQVSERDGYRIDVLSPLRWTLATRKRQVSWGWWQLAAGFVVLWLSVLALTAQHSS